jgi:tetratricopeptide (TPR) repeat protein
MSRLAAALALIILIVAVPLRTALAQDDPKVTEMRQHFETGQSLFEKGEFQKAADEFMAAYAAKQFPAFLFNAGVCYERLQKYDKAIELFERYLKESPEATDKADVASRIKVLKDAIAKTQEQPATQPANPDNGGNGTQPTATQPTATQPTEKPAPPVVPEQKTKGLVVIESKPAGATIYLDSKQSGSLGKTPWNGSLDGQHTIILESKGYKTETQKITPASDKLVYMYVGLSEEHYLGFVEIRSNVKHAEVFIDSKEQGSVGTTPWLGNLRPGKHTIWVSKDGYTEYTQAIDVQAGKALALNGNLDIAPYGFVTLRGTTPDDEGARVNVDGKIVCKALPCIKLQIPAGTHDMWIGKGGRKAFRKKIPIGKGTQTTVTVTLEERQGHLDAIAPFVIGAACLAGGYYLGTQVDKQIMGSDKQKEYRVGEIGAYAAGGLFMIYFVYDLFHEKGPPSKATIESGSLTWAPVMGPSYAGVGATGRF